jgi:hypothetical protein
MPVTPQENEKYRQFVNNIAIELGIFDFPSEQIIWHYTDGAGFLGILQSATVFATQVASLNDSRETKYGTDMFKAAIEALIEERKEDTDAIGMSELKALLNAHKGFGVNIKQKPSAVLIGYSKGAHPRLLLFIFPAADMPSADRPETGGCRNLC